MVYTKCHIATLPHCHIKEVYNPPLADMALHLSIEKSTEQEKTGD